MNHKKCSPGPIHVCLLCAVALALAVPASASWKEKVLYSFQGGTDGQLPVGSIVFDSAGNLYGATTQGGATDCSPVADCGTVFQLTPPVKTGDPWTETVLYTFKGAKYSDGDLPAGGLLINSQGKLYGTTAYGGTGDCVLLGIKGGCGTVYEMSPPAHKGGAWTETILYSFPTAKQGYLPNGDLVFDGAGNLYGATTFGGAKGTTCDTYYGGQCGVVFELSPPKTKGGKWTEKVLHNFAGGTDGANPNGGLVLDGKGAVYGTTYRGGSQGCSFDDEVGCGTAFRLRPPNGKDNAWIEEILHRFSDGSDGPTPQGGLILDAKGDAYGTTLTTVFRLTPPVRNPGSWKDTVLFVLCSGKNSGCEPEGRLIFDGHGNLYGTTYYGANAELRGSAFRLKPPPTKGGAWGIHYLHGFLGPPDGMFPAAGLAFDGAGNLYSTTQAGGTGNGDQCNNGAGGCGTVFEVSP
jgi:hypothetical protein